MMKQVARNVTMEGWGFFQGRRHLIIDRDSNFAPFFRTTVAGSGTKVVGLPPHSPNLNAYCKRWILSVKTRALSLLVQFGEQGLRETLSQYLAHYQAERNHQGKGNVLLFSFRRGGEGDRNAIACRERLGGMLKFYSREVA
jgi:hypothetical protein